MSLLSPDKHCLEYLDSIVNSLSWCGKPAKKGVEILEYKIKYGGLTYPFFNSTLKMSFLKVNAPFFRGIWNQIKLLYMVKIT